MSYFRFRIFLRLVHFFVIAFVSKHVNRSKSKDPVTHCQLSSDGGYLSSLKPAPRRRFVSFSSRRRTLFKMFHRVTFQNRFYLLLFRFRFIIKCQLSFCEIKINSVEKKRAKAKTKAKAKSKARAKGKARAKK